MPVSAWSRREERWVKESSEEEAPLLSPTVRRWASCWEMMCGLLFDILELFGESCRKLNDEKS